MKYKALIMYKDDKSLSVVLKEEQLSKFFIAINKREMYQDPSSKSGFWTDINEVRYITLAMMEENEQPVIEKVEKKQEDEMDSSEEENQGS